MACWYPGAGNIGEYWNNLAKGRDTLKHLTDEELARYEFNYDQLRANPDYVKVRSVLEDIDEFDAGVF